MGLRDQIAQLRAAIKKCQGKSLAYDKQNINHKGSENNLTAQKDVRGENMLWVSILAYL